MCGGDGELLRYESRIFDTRQKQLNIRHMIIIVNWIFRIKE